MIEARGARLARAGLISSAAAVGAFWAMAIPWFGRLPGWATALQVSVALALAWLASLVVIAPAVLLAPRLLARAGIYRWALAALLAPLPLIPIVLVFREAGDPVVWNRVQAMESVPWLLAFAVAATVFIGRCVGGSKAT